MTLDAQKALGFELRPYEYSYTRDDVILYHLGIGAGDPPTTDRELQYTLESRLRVLPTFGVLPAFETINSMLGGAVPGIELDLRYLLHGEHTLTVHSPLPPEGRLVNRARVPEIWDKRRAALVIVEVDTEDLSGRSLCTNRFSLFMRGDGGFGGDPGPRNTNTAPDRDADGVVEQHLIPQLALLYRLSGDKNPLHADPEFAHRGGFDRPIVHGLCTYGVVCKRVVDEVLGGDVSRVLEYGVRFAGVGYPGETYVISYWRESGKISLEVNSKERGEPVLTNAYIRFAE